MSTDVSETERPGIDRLNYFLSTIAVGFSATAAIVLFGPGSTITKVVSLILTVVGFVLDVMRLRNIGVSQWFAMLRLLPFVNLLYSIGLLKRPGRMGPNPASGSKRPDYRKLSSFALRDDVRSILLCRNGQAPFTSILVVKDRSHAARDEHKKVRSVYSGLAIVDPCKNLLTAGIMTR